MLACCTAASPPAPPVLEIGGAQCEVTYRGKTSRITLTNSPADVTSVSFIEPESVSGLVYTFDSSGCRVTLGDLSFVSDEPPADSRALPRLIRDILRSAAAEDALTVEKQGKKNSADDTAVFGGELNGLRYSLTCDASSGALREISSKAMGIDIVID